MYSCRKFFFLVLEVAEVNGVRIWGMVNVKETRELEVHPRTGHEGSYGE